MTDKIEEQGHKRGCEGRNYACTCGYDDRVDAEIARLRSSNEAMRKALRPFADACEKVERFVQARVEQGGSPHMPFRDFRLAHFQAARAALQVGSK